MAKLCYSCENFEYDRFAGKRRCTAGNNWRKTKDECDDYEEEENDDYDCNCCIGGFSK